MAPRDFFSMSCIVIVVLAGLQQLQAQTHKKSQVAKAVELRKRMFQERHRLEQRPTDPALPESNPLAKTLASDGQIVYRYITALAISPDFANDQTMVAAVANTGLYRSYDAGITWELVNNTTNINCIAFSPNYANDNTIFVGANAFFKSEDNGDTWKIIIGAPTTSVDFSTNYLQDSTIYASASNLSVFPTQWPGYAVSRDGGKTWQGFPQPLPRDPFSSTYPIYDIRISPTFSADSILFISSEVGYFKSADGGNQWVQLWGSGDLFGPTPVDRIAFCPVKNSTILALAGTDIGLYQIAHEDTVWLPGDPARVILAESVSEIIFSPEYEKDQTIFVSTAAGVFKSTDNGQTWTAENRGLTDLNIETFAMSPNFVNDRFLAVGTHDGVFISDTPQIEWKPRNNSLPTSFGVTNLSKDPHTLDHNPRIVSSMDDALHVFWKGIHFSETKGEVVNDTYYQKRFEENGQTVKIPTPIEGFAWGSFEVETDKNGSVHLLLSVGDNTQSNVYYTNNRSGNFTLHVFSRSNEITGDLKIDAKGFAHIIGRKGSFRHLFYSTNKSGQFETVELTHLPEHSFIYGETPTEKTIPNIKIDSGGNLHLFYPGESQNAFGDLYYSNNSTGDFSEFTTISNTSDPVSDFFVVVDKMNTPHFIYTLSSTRGRYHRLTSDSLSNPIGFSTWNIADVIIDGSDKIHLSASRGSDYITIKNDEITELNPLKGFTTHFTVRGGGLAITNEDNIHIVRSQRSNNIKSDFDFDVYLISFKSNSNSGHIAYGSLLNEDDSVPANGDITFQAYITSRSGEILTETTTGGGYQNGQWSVQCATFPSQWQVDEILHVNFTNTATGQTASVSDTLTTADLDLFPTVRFGQTTGISDATRLPKEFHVSQNYPNPFNPETTIKYQLPQAADVKLEIYNLLGQRVAVLVEKKQPAGDYTISWDGRNTSGQQVASGVYVYRLHANNFVKVRKLVLIR